MFGYVVLFAERRFAVLSRVKPITSFLFRLRGAQGGGSETLEIVPYWFSLPSFLFSKRKRKVLRDLPEESSYNGASTAMDGGQKFTGFFHYNPLVFDVGYPGKLSGPGT